MTIKWGSWVQGTAFAASLLWLQQESAGKAGFEPSPTSLRPLDGG